MLYDEIQSLVESNYYLPDDTIMVKLRYYMNNEKNTIISAFNDGVSSVENQSDITNGQDYYNSKYDEQY